MDEFEIDRLLREARPAFQPSARSALVDVVDARLRARRRRRTAFVAGAAAVVVGVTLIPFVVRPPAAMPSADAAPIEQVIAELQRELAALAQDNRELAHRAASLDRSPMEDRVASQLLSVAQLCKESAGEAGAANADAACRFVIAAFPETTWSRQAARMQSYADPEGL